jgi:hypothetical protein
MSQALKKAFDAASRLSEQDQDELAAAILDELAAEERWEAGWLDRNPPWSGSPARRRMSIGRV